MSVRIINLGYIVKKNQVWLGAFHRVIRSMESLHNALEHPPSSCKWRLISTNQWGFLAALVLKIGLSELKPITHRIMESIMNLGFLRSLGKQRVAAYKNDGRRA